MAIDGVPKPLALKLRDALGIKTFIETGTYKGDTTRWASGEFENVISIEAYKPRFTKTKAAIGADYPNIKLCYGSSRTRLAKERAKIDGPVMMWLDAHWCGNYELSEGTEGECPLLDELEAVQDGDVIFIDDARLFIAPPPRPHDPAQWPTYKEIRDMMPGWDWDIIGDVIMGIPKQDIPIVKVHDRKYSKPQAVVVASNDYIGCIPGFCYQWMKHMGPDYQAMIVRYEKPYPKQAPNFKGFAIGNQADYSWTSGLERALRYYHGEHLILMLEDYWLTNVNHEQLWQLWRYAQDNPDVVKIDLTGDRVKVKHEYYEPVGDIEMVKSAPDAAYRGSLQAAIWRRDYLLDKLAEQDWSPWEFEKYGKIDRALILGVKLPVMEYVNAVGGQGNKPGQYDRRKFPVTLWQELERKGFV